MNNKIIVVPILSILVGFSLGWPLGGNHSLLKLSGVSQEEFSAIARDIPEMVKSVTRDRDLSAAQAVSIYWFLKKQEIEKAEAKIISILEDYQTAAQRDDTRDEDREKLLRLVNKALADHKNPS